MNNEHDMMPVKEHLEKMLDLERQLREKREESIALATRLETRASEHRMERNLAVILAAIAVLVTFLKR